MDRIIIIFFLLVGFSLKANDSTIVTYNFEKHFRNDSIQPNQTLYSIKNKLGQWKLDLPEKVKNTRSIETNFEANTTTLKFADSIYYDSIGLVIDYNFVCWTGNKSLKEYFEYDTSNIINNYEGSILEYGAFETKKNEGYFHISTSPFDTNTVYSISYYIRGKKKSYLVTSNIISPIKILTKDLRYVLNYFYAVTNSIRVKG